MIWSKRLYAWLWRREIYVTADPRDSSVTLSSKLFHLLDVMGSQEAEVRVFVFYVKETGNYAFAVNPAIEQETVMPTIQVNMKHMTIGFETLCPTVQKIFYDYCLPSDEERRLDVRRCTRRRNDGSRLVYYEMIRPWIY